MENSNCSCPHMACPLHSDCKQCIEFHKGKPYCKVGKFKKVQMRVIFNVYDTVTGIKKANSNLKNKTKNLFL